MQSRTYRFKKNVFLGLVTALLVAGPAPAVLAASTIQLYHNGVSQSYTLDAPVLSEAPNGGTNGIVSETQISGSVQETQNSSSANKIINPVISDAGTVKSSRDVSPEPLPGGQFGETTITSLHPPMNGGNTFTITAASAIGKIEKNLLSDNRMYIDIYDAENGITQTSYTLADNPNVASIRVAQNQITPVKITRIVFNLKDGAVFAVSLSSDRKTITVSFSRNTITDLAYTTNGTGNTVVLTSINAPVMPENANNIYTPVMPENANNTYIPVMPEEKHQKIVIIDPGHGGNDPGTNGYGLVEKNLNLDIANRLMALIEQDGRIKAYATRTTDINPGREERAEFANNMGDLFVSIHTNYNEIRKGVANPVPNGTEVYYFPHDNDAAVGFTSRQAADIIHRNLINGLGSYDRKVRTNDYTVLTNTRIPAVLCEIGFLSNESDAMKLGSEAYRQQVAVSLYKGILETFEYYTPVR